MGIVLCFIGRAIGYIKFNLECFWHCASVFFVLQYVGSTSRALILYVFLLYLVLFGLGSLVAMGPFGSSGLFSMGCPADKSFLSTADAALQWAFTAVTDTLHFLADVLYKTVAFFDSLPYSPIEYVPNVIDLLLVLWCLAYVLLAHAVHTARQPTRQPQDGAQRRKIDKCSALKNRGLVKKSKKPCAPS